MCGLRVPLDRYSGHALLCALTRTDAVGSGSALFSLLGDGGGLGGDYETNLRLQDSMGGSVKKACRDVNAAAPIAERHDLERCPVCLQDTDATCRVRKATECSHEFCAECMERWLSEHTTCPICVADLSVNGGHRFVMDADETQTIAPPGGARRPWVGRSQPVVSSVLDLPPLVPSAEPVTLPPVFPLFSTGVVSYGERFSTAPRIIRSAPSPPGGVRLSPLRPPPSRGGLGGGERAFHPREAARRHETASEALYHLGRVRDILDGAAHSRDSAEG